MRVQKTLQYVLFRFSDDIISIRRCISCTKIYISYKIYSIYLHGCIWKSKQISPLETHKNIGLVKPAWTERIQLGYGTKAHTHPHIIYIQKTIGVHVYYMRAYIIYILLWYIQVLLQIQRRRSNCVCFLTLHRRRGYTGLYTIGLRLLYIRNFVIWTQLIRQGPGR